MLGDVPAIWLCRRRIHDTSTSGARPLSPPNIVSVQEDVLEEERDVSQGGLGGEVGASSASAEDDQVGPGPEGHLQLDVVVHQGDEGEGEPRVPVEPELEGHVEGGGGMGCVLLGEEIVVTGHDLEAEVLLSGFHKLRVDREPETRVFVNGLMIPRLSAYFLGHRLYLKRASAMRTHNHLVVEASPFATRVGARLGACLRIVSCVTQFTHCLLAANQVPAQRFRMRVGA